MAAETYGMVAAMTSSSRCSWAVFLRLWCVLVFTGLAASQRFPYDNFMWVQRMGIVGDSYTAGIGAGKVLETKADWDCSRYDGSWAVQMARYFWHRPMVQNLACSGDQTPDISEQIASLSGDMDLVVLTAGGNDLCLNSLLLECIFKPLATVAGCHDMVRLSQAGLDTYFRENVQTLLEELLPKMRTGGVILLSSYAQFFNQDTNACSDEHWSLSPLAIPLLRLPLNRERRSDLNDLVTQTNAQLARAAANVDDTTRGIRVAFSNWDPWTRVVQGRYCELGQSSNPRLASNLQFYKLDTTPFGADSGSHWNSGLRRRSNSSVSPVSPVIFEQESHVEAMEREHLAYLQSFVANETQKMRLRARSSLGANGGGIGRRAITQPNCPEPGFLSSIPLADFLGKLFHPTIDGHATMMTFALNELRHVRAQQLGIPGPGCNDLAPDCTGRPSEYTPYTSWDGILAHFTSFCESTGRAIARWSSTSSFWHTSTYNRLAPDHVRLRIDYQGSGQPSHAAWSTATCVEEFRHLASQCARRTSTSATWRIQPLTAGSVLRGGWLYRIDPMEEGRIWPIPSRARASVTGSYVSGTGAVSYTVLGASFATWDSGQNTLLASFRECNGGRSPVSWGFRYLRPPSQDGYEWEAVIQTSSADRLVCMDNGDVIREAGGPYDVRADWAPRPNSWELVCNLPSDVISSLTCNKDCCGFHPCSSWCYGNCLGTCRGPRDDLR